MLPSVETEFQTAVQHHQAGRLAQAQLLYQQVLLREPGHAVALHLLGVLAAQGRQFDLAVQFIGRAIAINPNVPEFHANLGSALRESGQLDKSIEAYRRSLRLKPDSADTLNYLGGALKSKGLIDQAIAAHRQAIVINPAYPDAHNDLGLALAERGQLDAAIESYRQAIRIRPAYPQAWNNLGVALAAKGQLDDAIAAYDQAIALKPDHEPYNNLANALGRAGRLDEAIAAYRAAARLKPDAAEVFNNLGLALFKRGLLDEAIAASDQAIRLKPDFAYPHWNIAQALLQKGNFERGWQEYEWRWRWKDFPSPPRNFPQPLWRGEDLTGRTILVHMEQGRGDVLQFIRYVPLVARRAGRVLLECPADIFGMLDAGPNVQNVVFAAGELLPPFDVHCPLLSLPLAFNTRVETVPAEVPYLRVAPAMVEAWRQKLGKPMDRRRVGLVWAGNPAHGNDKERSITLAQLAPLSRVPGITFYSLQKGDAASQAADVSSGVNLIDHSAALQDFSDTAALIMQLDLVIAADTAVAHLAGALGKKVWVLLQHPPDWRWLADREDSPWYPTMRLFCQKRTGDWSKVIGRIARALEVF